MLRRVYGTCNALWDIHYPVRLPYTPTDRVQVEGTIGTTPYLHMSGSTRFYPFSSSIILTVRPVSLQYRLSTRWVQYIKVLCCAILVLIPALGINAKIGRGEAASFPWGVSVCQANNDGVGRFTNSRQEMPQTYLICLCSGRLSRSPAMHWQLSAGRLLWP